MTTKRDKSRVVGAVLGVVLVGAAIAAVVFIDWRPAVEEEPPPVRPLKTMVVGSVFAPSGRKFPGKVRAGREVNLAFEVPGTLIELPVKNGDEVDEGQLLARLDPQDYENDLDAAQAELERAEAHRDRIRRAAEKNAVSQQELSDAEAAFNVAQAQVNIKAKALDDTNLRARFGGRIATTFVENFENVSAKQQILSLQDISSVEIEFNVPEERIALARRGEEIARLAATFDYLRGREFDVTLKELAMEADPQTQTYAATGTMPAPDDVVILPGMTATITVYEEEAEPGEGSGFAIPVDAVPIDELGQYYVWVVDEQEGGEATVRRVDVKVGEMAMDEDGTGTILVRDGIKKGDRIALAGVHLLQEGQLVRLFGSQEGAGSQ